MQLNAVLPRPLWERGIYFNVDFCNLVLTIGSYQNKSKLYITSGSKDKLFSFVRSLPNTHWITTVTSTSASFHQRWQDDRGWYLYGAPEMAHGWVVAPAGLSATCGRI